MKMGHWGIGHGELIIILPPLPHATLLNGGNLRTQVAPLPPLPPLSTFGNYRNVRNVGLLLLFQIRMRLIKIASDIFL